MKRTVTITIAVDPTEYNDTQDIGPRTPTKHRFAETFCSACGGSFGPGDSGYSHCSNHAGMKNLDE